jgi:hypothetical protein
MDIQELLQAKDGLGEVLPDFGTATQFRYGHTVFFTQICKIQQ